MKTLWKGMLGVALSAAVILANPAAAQDTAPDSNGISAYSVARLKIFEGSVWVRTPDSGDWEEYIHNSPLAERSRISVPEGSEAEVQFHGGQFVLLTGGTEMDIREMRENKTETRRIFYSGRERSDSTFPIPTSRPSICWLLTRERLTFPSRDSTG
jgi:hypothetical protein